VAKRKAASRRRSAARGREASPRRPSGKSAAGGRRRSGWRVLFRITALLLLGGGFAAGFWTARQAVVLDAVVRERFEGRLFRVASRVLSAPTILYPGLDWKQIDLRGTLSRLGYGAVESEKNATAGHFTWQGNYLLLHRRPFEHPSRAEPARRIKIKLKGAFIDELQDADSGRDLGAVFLEPELVGAYYGPHHEQRELVRVGDVPQHLIDAVLAVEDQRFEQHAGVDPRRIAGALLANLRAGGITQGGSTLTQQLVKNFFLSPERSYRRKLNEAAMAVIVEARYDKNAILEAYLNEIYLGQRGSTSIHGVGEASRLYFGKNVHQISLEEAALLAAIIQSPNRHSPYRQPERALSRRDLVLRLMNEQERIDQASYEAAVATPLRLAEMTPEPREARYFLDALQRQLPDYYDPESLTTEGLRIYSTLDVRLQRAATQVVREELERLEKNVPSLKPRPGAGLQACLVALRPQTGEVLALVRGRSYAESQFDRCTQGRRPAGSVFKPFVYMAALEPVPGGPVMTLASFVDDTPLKVPVPGGIWEPRNFTRKFHGRVSVRTALEKSYNVAAARIGRRVGIDRVIDVARRLGIESEMQRVPALAIGAADLTPLELARAYATIANGGIRPRVRTFEDVVDPDGGSVQRQPIDFERVLDAGTAYLAVSLLEGVVNRGTGKKVRAAGIEGPVAGKTGTSNDERDAWFVGFTPEMVVAIWVGFDAPRSLGLPSSQIAAPIFARFLKEVTGGQVRGSFRKPGDVAAVAIHPPTGALALAGCSQERTEYFLRGTEPTTTCPSWGTDQDGGGADGGEGGRNWFERWFDRWLDDR